MGYYFIFNFQPAANIMAEQNTVNQMTSQSLEVEIKMAVVKAYTAIFRLTRGKLWYLCI